MASQDKDQSLRERLIDKPLKEEQAEHEIPAVSHIEKNKFIQKDHKGMLGMGSTNCRFDNCWCNRCRIYL